MDVAVIVSPNYIFESEQNISVSKFSNCNPGLTNGQITQMTASNCFVFSSNNLINYFLKFQTTTKPKRPHEYAYMCRPCLLAIHIFNLEK